MNEQHAAGPHAEVEELRGEVGLGSIVGMILLKWSLLQSEANVLHGFTISSRPFHNDYRSGILVMIEGEARVIW